MARAQARVPGVEARAGKFPGPSLIPALNAIQERLGWLPREELVALARDVRRPLYEIEGLISFYPHFRTEPPAKVALHACHDLSCWLQGADERIAALRERYGDGRRGRGRRGLLHRPLRHRARGGRQRAPGPARRGRRAGRAARARQPVSCTVPRRTTRRRTVAQRPVRRPAGQRALRGCCAPCWPASWTPARSITALTGRRAARHGRRRLPHRPEVGARRGAGRPSPKYVICNADESEPGTFKDRQILAEQPHLVLEGLLLGMLAVGAEEGWVFIRHEYGPEEAVIRARARGAARRRAARRRTWRGSGPAAQGRGVHLAGRLHPRRGVGADRVHGGPPRRAAQQAAVPRRPTACGASRR